MYQDEVGDPGAPAPMGEDDDDSDEDDEEYDDEDEEEYEDGEEDTPGQHGQQGGKTNQEVLKNFYEVRMITYSNGMVILEVLSRSDR